MSLDPTTLQSFVTNLLTDDVALSAFAADPTAVLQGAGLGDITPQDVQQVIPLVTDFAQLPGLNALGGGLPVLDGSLPALPTLPTDQLNHAVAQLQAIADAASASTGLPLPQVGFDSDSGPDGLAGAVTATGADVTGTAAGSVGPDGASLQGGLDSLYGTLAGGGTVGLSGVDGHLDAASQQLQTWSASDLTANLNGVTTATSTHIFDNAVSGAAGVTTDGVNAEAGAQTDLAGAHGAINAGPDGISGHGGIVTSELGAHGQLQADQNGFGLVANGDSSHLGNFQVAAAGDADRVATHGELNTGAVSASNDLSVGQDGVATTASADSQFGGLGLTAEGSTQGVDGAAELHGAGITGSGGLSAGLNGVAGQADIDSQLGHVDLAGAASTSGAGATVDLGNDLVDVQGNVAAGTDGITLGGDLHAPIVGDLPLGPVTLPVAVPGQFGGLGDPANILDSAEPARGGEAAVADYVSNGGQVLAGGIQTGADTLGQYLTGTPVAPLAGVVETGGQTVAGVVSQGADTVASHVPALPAVPVVSDLPNAVGDLPSHLPVVGDLPNVADLPNLTDLPSVVTDLPSHLPVDLPNLPVANPLPDVTHTVTDVTSHVTDVTGLGNLTDVVTNNPVTDVVSHSPLGNLTGGDHSLLPDTGILPDLHLGH